MVDLTDICGDDAQIVNIQKKRQKAHEKLAKIEEKSAPIKADIVMYDEMIAAIIKRKNLAVVDELPKIDENAGANNAA